MEQKMTIKEALTLTIQQLRGIMIPVELSDTVGMKVKDAMNNIGVCIQAMETAQAEHEQRKGVEDGRETDPGERDEDPGTSD